MPLLLTGSGSAAGGGAPPPWTPANLGASLVLFLQEKAGFCYINNPPTTPCVVDDLIETVTPQFGPTVSGVQTTSGLRPVFKTDGSSFDGTALAALPLSSPVSLVGDFTAYLSGNRNTGSWVPVSGNVAFAGGAILVYLNDTLFVFNDVVSSVSVAFPTTGPLLVRVRRQSGTVYAAWTGTVEQTLGALAGSVTADTVGAYPSQNIYGVAPSRYRLQTLVDRNLTAGEMAQFEAWIAANDGGVL